MEDRWKCRAGDELCALLYTGQVNGEHVPGCSSRTLDTIRDLRPMGTPRSRQSSRCKHGIALMSISFSASVGVRILEVKTDSPSRSRPWPDSPRRARLSRRPGRRRRRRTEQGRRRRRRVAPDGRPAPATRRWRVGVGATRAPTRTASVTGCLQLGQLFCWRLNHARCRRGRTLGARRGRRRGGPTLPLHTHRARRVVVGRGQRLDDEAFREPTGAVTPSARSSFVSHAREPSAACRAPASRGRTWRCRSSASAPAAAPRPSPRAPRRRPRATRRPCREGVVAAWIWPICDERPTVERRVLQLQRGVGGLGTRFEGYGRAAGEQPSGFSRGWLGFLFCRRR